MPDAKADELLDQLRDEFTRQIRQAIAELPGHQALQMADALCRIQLEVMSGLRVSYRKQSGPDGDAISEDWANGLSPAEIQRKHRVSRATAYRYHPRNLAGSKAG